MKRKYLCSLVVSIIMTLFGCGDRPQVPDQIAFEHQISLFRRRNDDLNYLNIKGKDERGRLAPADISEQVKASDREILHFLKETPRNAVQWMATVVDVRRKGDMIIISAIYGTQSYSLHIFDPEAIKIGEQFVGDEEITFSGNLGPERSLTIWGGLVGPDFNLYPTYISSKHGEI